LTGVERQGKEEFKRNRMVRRVVKNSETYSKKHRKRKRERKKRVRRPKTIGKVNYLN